MTDQRDLAKDFENIRAQRALGQMTVASVSAIDALLAFIASQSRELELQREALLWCLANGAQCVAGMDAMLWRAPSSKRVPLETPKKYAEVIAAACKDQP